MAASSGNGSSHPGALPIWLVVCVMARLCPFMGPVMTTIQPNGQHGVPALPVSWLLPLVSKGRVSRSLSSSLCEAETGVSSISEVLILIDGEVRAVLLLSVVLSAVLSEQFVMLMYSFLSIERLSE